MISNQIMQKTIEGISQISKINFAVTDVEGTVLASTMLNVSHHVNDILEFVASPADSQVLATNQYIKIKDEARVEYILLAVGDTQEAVMMSRVAAFQIQELMVAYKERFDKDNFIKNLLLDNLLLVDIYNRAKKLHVDTSARRVVMIVETGPDKDGNELDRVRNVFGGKMNDFVTAVDENNIIVVKEIEPINQWAQPLKKIANCLG